MRKILCPEHGAMKPTPPEDAERGLYERRFRGILAVNVVCDICNKDLLIGSEAVAVSLPQNLPEWESQYFHPLSADFWDADFAQAFDAPEQDAESKPETVASPA